MVDLADAYCTVDELVAHNSATSSAAVSVLERAIKACTGGISQYCSRNFSLTASTALLFALDNAYEFDLGPFNDLVTLDALATDATGDGTFETTWTSADWELLPLNVASGPEQRPYTRIRACGSKTFPYLAPGETGRTGRVRLTATWGWPAIPDAVRQACLLHSARIFNRKESPQGVIGWGDFGAVRVRNTDPDVIDLLADYRLGPRVAWVRI